MKPEVRYDIAGPHGTMETVRKQNHRMNEVGKDL